MQLPTLPKRSCRPRQIWTKSKLRSPLPVPPSQPASSRPSLGQSRLQPADLVLHFLRSGRGRQRSPSFRPRGPRGSLPGSPPPRELIGWREEGAHCSGRKRGPSSPQPQTPRNLPAEPRCGHAHPGGLRAPNSQQTSAKPLLSPAGCAGSSHTPSLGGGAGRGVRRDTTGLPRLQALCKDGGCRVHKRQTP